MSNKNAIQIKPIRSARAQDEGQSSGSVTDVEMSWTKIMLSAPWPTRVLKNEFMAESVYILIETQLESKRRFPNRDPNNWLKSVVEGTAKRILPLALRAAADDDECPPKKYEDLRRAADACQVNGDEESVVIASDASSCENLLSEGFDEAEAPKWFGSHDKAHACASELRDAFGLLNEDPAVAAEAAALAVVAAASVSTSIRTAVLTEAVNIALEAYRSA